MQDQRGTATTDGAVSDLVEPGAANRTDAAIAVPTGAIPPPDRIRVLISGGGARAMFGAIGSIGYLMSTGEWERVSEVVSVSGGSATNAVLLASPESNDALKLRAFYERLVVDRLRPWATGRRAIAALGIVLLLVGSVAGALTLAGVLPGDAAPRPLLAILVGLLLSPVLIQLGRRLLSAYMRDALETATGGRGRTLASCHDEQATRQHVFCASGLATGAPYYFWAGGAHFLSTGRDAGSVQALDAQKRWGAAVDPQRRPHYTIGEVVFASSSLPFIGGVMSPCAQSDDERGIFTVEPEPLVDGGGSGVFGQQVRDPFWKPPGSEAYRGARGGSRVSTVIAIDAMRHTSAAASGVGQRIGAFVRDKLSVMSMLVRWVKISGEALYVNDLLDTDGVTLVRLCSPDLPRRQWSAPEEATWRAAWSEVRESRQKQHRVDDAAHGGRSVQERLTELRDETGRIELFNVNEQRAINAVTTGAVAAYLAREPRFDEGALVRSLDSVGELLFGPGSERAPKLRERWESTAGRAGDEGER